MSTHASITVEEIIPEFCDANGKVDGRINVLVRMYKHWDGDFAGVGRDIAKFLSNIKMVNGLGIKENGVANGAGCLAAQLVAHLKDVPGDLYLTSDTEREEYHYCINYNVQTGVLFLQAGRDGNIRAYSVEDFCKLVGYKGDDNETD